MSQSILVIAAHPDDEVLGCGGTIAKHAINGDLVHVLILAEGITSRHLARDRLSAADELSSLTKAAKKAGEVLGVASNCFHSFPDNRMDSVDLLDIVKIIEDNINQYRPGIIYTHHAGDVNIDHQRIHNATAAACRPLPGCFVQTVLFFEVASSTEWQFPASAPGFIPNWFVDISSTLERKIMALTAYNSEMRPWPHARSIKALEHLARWRGATIGTEAAEAFMMGRNILM
jgi:LmbE family N-acetylglucosaminyl deacetylase